MAKTKQPQDFSFMTDRFQLQAVYLDFKMGRPSDVYGTEHNINEALSLVAGKRAITDITKEFRTWLQAQARGFEAVRNARLAAEKKAKRLKYKIGFYFDLKELMWKDLKKKSIDYKICGRASDAQRVYGRCLGQILYDVTAVPTGLWTVDALRQLLAGNDNKGNTDEHYMSLHANAGPDMLLDALGKDIRFDIDDFSFLIFKNIQTNRTTCDENMRLSTYHKNNPMKSPQHSYEQAGVSQLVQVGKVAKSREVWDVIFEEYPRVNQADAEAPFDNVLTLEEAIAQYPELEPLRNHKF